MRNAHTETPHPQHMVPWEPLQCLLSSSSTNLGDFEKKNKKKKKKKRKKTYQTPPPHTTHTPASPLAQRPQPTRRLLLRVGLPALRLGSRATARVDRPTKNVPRVFVGRLPNPTPPPKKKKNATKKATKPKKTVCDLKWQPNPKSVESRFAAEMASKPEKCFKLFLPLKWQPNPKSC